MPKTFKGFVEISTDKTHFSGTFGNSRLSPVFRLLTVFLHFFAQFKEKEFLFWTIFITLFYKMNVAWKKNTNIQKNFQRERLPVR